MCKKHYKGTTVKKLTCWLVSRLIKDHDQIQVPKVRMKYGIFEGTVSILVNTILFMIKLFVGIQIQSTALIADAIHTIGDTATSVIVIIGFVLAKKPSDKEHPFGHGRVEPIATLIISVLLFVAGFELLKHSIGRITNPSVSDASISVIILISGTLVIKELLARFSYKLGNIIDSETLKADALHHRTDVFATALVVIALIASRYGFYYADGIMGALVSLVIFYSAYKIANKAIHPLLGQAPPREFLKIIESLTLSVAGVGGIHDIIFHQYGTTIIISLHIEVPDDLSAVKLHEISEQVEEKIAKKFNGVVVVHIDPINKQHPQYESIAMVLDGIVQQDTRIDSYHDLRIVGESPISCNVIFEVALSSQSNEADETPIKSYIKDEFLKTFPKMKLVIKVDPNYSYNL
jgi:cation diffusion facilitator family transporter